HLTAAHRAMSRNLKRPPARALRVDADYFWNHVSRALNHHRIAHLQTEPGDLVFIVQGGARYLDPADLDRCEPRDRRQGSGAANLYIDVLNRGDCLPRGIFECNGPARRFRRETKPDLLLDRVHFDDDAVDLVRQIVAL